MSPVWSWWIERLMRVFRRLSWLAIGSHLALLFLAGGVLMPLVEPAGSALREPTSYAWWFFVTITTVGYGDIAPRSGAGRALAVFIMLFGIGAIGVAIGKLGELYFEVGRRSMRGLSQLEESGHVIIFGYRAGETEQIVEELLADRAKQASIVLCASEPEENPIPDRVKFVRGDLTSDDVLGRACVGSADRIVIHCDDDNETLLSALAVTAANPRAHIVTHLQREESRRHLARVNPAIEVVMSVTIPMIVQALQDPGVTQLVQRLLSNVSDDVFYSLRVPEGAGEWTFGALLRALKERHDAILIGIAGEAGLEVNPGADSPVIGGAVLYYIAIARLTDVDWQALGAGEAPARAGA